MHAGYFQLTSSTVLIFVVPAVDLNQWDNFACHVTQTKSMRVQNRLSILFLYLKDHHSFKCPMSSKYLTKDD